MLEKMEIQEATAADVGGWLNLALQLWPTSSSDELERILQNILDSDREVGVIARLGGDAPIAFMNLSVRSDYVLGATQRPVAYLEGIYVIDAYRNRGVARRLIEYAENWAASHGCNQLASDSLLDNVKSQSFHKHVGFREVARTVAFIKDVIKHP